MRHAKLSRATPRAVTPRRLKAAQRALEREKERYGLFADQLELVTPQQRLSQADREQQEHWQRIRDHTAQTWRRARAVLFSLPAGQRDQLLDEWNLGPWPAQAAYFAEFLYRRTRLRSSSS